ncbi:hypothetical protein [Geomonas sp. Red276]
MGISLSTCLSGELIHLRVKDSQGQVVYQVCGQDCDDLGRQLALTAIQKMSTDQLKILHKTPLKKVLGLAAR